MTTLPQTAIQKMLGCRYPIIQTAMGWVATPELVAGTCNAGGIGFLAAGVMKAEEVGPAIDRVRALTDAPFGVNFHMFQPGAAQIVETLIEKKVAAVSFGRGPDKTMIARFKDAGIRCIPTVGAVKHAKKMVELGVDMVVVQGGEGGGHTGSVSSTILLPQVLDAVKVPVVAAGGFGDGRGLAAALAYGAEGIAMGTRFLMTKESPVPDQTKERYVKASVDDIFVTTKLDGLPQTHDPERVHCPSGKVGRYFDVDQRSYRCVADETADWGQHRGDAEIRPRDDGPWQRFQLCPSAHGRDGAGLHPTRRRGRQAG